MQIPVAIGTIFILKIFISGPAVIKTKTNTKKRTEKTIASPILSPKIKNPKKLHTAPTCKDSQAGDKLSKKVERPNAIPEPKITVNKTTIKPGFLTSYLKSSFVMFKT